MALKKASEVEVEGGDWLDFKELAKSNTAALFSVREIEDEVDMGNGPLCPVRCRVVVLSGELAGTVHENERIINKGIFNRLTTVGDDVVGRLRLYGTRKNPGLEKEESGDVELAEQWLAHLDDDGPKPGAKAADSGSGPSKVGTKSASKAKAEPVEDTSSDEDEPDF